MIRLEVIGLAFCAAAALGQKITDVIPGALFLASEGDSDFQPQTFKPLSTDSAFQKRLDGLLQIRQSRSCPSGYGACPDGVRCCPSGGRCCTRGKHNFEYTTILLMEMEQVAVPPVRTSFLDELYLSH
jgi:hypothetical protein